MLSLAKPIQRVMPESSRTTVDGGSPMPLATRPSDELRAATGDSQTPTLTIPSEPAGSRGPSKVASNRLYVDRVPDWRPPIRCSTSHQLSRPPHPQYLSPGIASQGKGSPAAGLGPEHGYLTHARSQGQPCVGDSPDTSYALHGKSEVPLSIVHEEALWPYHHSMAYILPEIHH